MVKSAYTVQFDYKFSTTKLERFVPKGDGSGTGHYVGYDGWSYMENRKQRS
jgi:hypothetical protein